MWCYLLVVVVDIELLPLTSVDQTCSLLSVPMLPPSETLRGYEMELTCLMKMCTHIDSHTSLTHKQHYAHCSYHTQTALCTLLIPHTHTHARGAHARTRTYTHTHTHTWTWLGLGSHPQDDVLVLKNLTLSTSVTSRTSCYTLVSFFYFVLFETTFDRSHKKGLHWNSDGSNKFFNLHTHAHTHTHTQSRSTHTHTTHILCMKCLHKLS